MNKSNVIVGILAVVALVVGFTAYTKTESVVGPQGPRGEQGVPGRNGKDGVTTVINKTSPSLGAVSGPFQYQPQVGVNDVIEQPRRVATPSTASLATTTICSIQAPTQGTSTLTYATVKLDVSSTSASIIDIARSSNTGATTTKIGTTYSIDANAQALIVASTSPAAAANNVFAPGQYLVVNMKGGTNNAFYPTGVCTAVWTSTY